LFLFDVIFVFLAFDVVVAIIMASTSSSGSVRKKMSRTAWQ
jgi:hypothetical protein